MRVWWSGSADMRDEKFLAFDLSFSLLKNEWKRENVHERSRKRETKSLDGFKNRGRGKKKFSAPTSVPLLCKDQVKRSKKIRTKSLGFKCLSCTQISLPECFFLTRRAKIQKNSREFYNRKRWKQKKVRRRSPLGNATHFGVLIE